MNLYFNREPVSPEDCASRYPDGEFASPMRSTVPLLDAMRHGSIPAFLDELLVRVGVDPSESMEFRFEFQVPPAKGRGKPSHTDLMVLDAGPPRFALAIEAKWTEPRYETVSRWLGAGSSPENRREVLRGWLDVIAGRTGFGIRLEGCGDLVYQMVHRAASAVFASGAGGRAAMAYVIFKTEGEGAQRGAALPVEECRNDLRRLRAIAGSSESLPLFLVTVPVRPTPAFVAVANLRKGCPNTGESIRSALSEAGSPLFAYGTPMIEPI